MGKKQHSHSPSKNEIINGRNKLIENNGRQAKAAKQLYTRRKASKNKRTLSMMKPQ